MNSDSHFPPFHVKRVIKVLHFNLKKVYSADFPLDSMLNTEYYSNKHVANNKGGEKLVLFFNDSQL